jgi:tetratricopeptide (TPR) repeat protein
LLYAILAGTTVSHPSHEALKRFLSGDEATPGDGDVARHLLPDCAVCSEVVLSWWANAGRADAGAAGGTGAAQDEARYDELFVRMLSEVKRLEAVVVAERREAARLLPRLLQQPLERQLILVGNSRQYGTAAVCERLLEASYAQRHDDPSKSEALAQVAVAASSRLDPVRYGDALVHDLKGRCWTYLANARRVLGDFTGAKAALATAWSLLADGTGSPLDEAFWWEVETSLRSARQEPVESARCVGRAIALYRRIGDRHLLGRALILQGMVWGYAEDLCREIVLVRIGLQLMDPDRDARVALSGWHNLCWALHHVGEERQALAALARARPVYLRLGPRSLLLRFQWLEGTIAASLHRDEQAEGCLREAREGFIQLGVAIEAAEVSLDLASLLCRQGRTAEVRRLAVEMIAIFESMGIREEALAAFILLRQAAERDRVTEALLQQLGSRLREPKARG